MSAPDPLSPLARCPACFRELPPDALVCPECGRLVYTGELDSLAQEAQRAAVANDVSEELRIWREMLTLIPPGSPRHASVSARIRSLSLLVDSGAQTVSPEHDSGPNWIKRLGPLAPLIFLIWKFKGIALLIGTKGKLLLLGLTKFSTFSSMLISIGVYWTIYGWPFAVGLVLAIYVHEMGHVYALRQYGIAASAPMFIPMLGAFVRLKQHPMDAREDARVGLAGPIWGTAAAIAAFVVFASTEIGVIGAVAHFAAWLNLFNLMPIWQLDGGRAFRALDTKQRWIVVAVLAGAWFVSREGFLLILAAMAIFRVFKKDTPEQGDTTALIQFCGLIVVLAVLMGIPAPARLE